MLKYAFFSLDIFNLRKERVPYAYVDEFKEERTDASAIHVSSWKRPVWHFAAVGSQALTRDRA